MTVLTIYTDYDGDTDSDNKGDHDYTANIGNAKVAYRAYVRFPLADLPAGVMISQIRLIVYCWSAGGASHLLDIHPYGGDGQANPDADSADSCYSRCAAGTPYINDDTSLRSTGGKTFTLGGTVIADVAAAKTAVDRFSLGLHEEGDNDATAKIACIEQGNKAQLEITYTLGTTYTKTVTEVFSVSEALTKQKASYYTRIVTEGFSIGEALTKQKIGHGAIQEVDFWQIPVLGGEMIVKSPVAADFEVTTTELEEGTLVQFTLAATTDLVVPGAGEFVKVLSAFYYCRDDIVTELRWKTSDEAVLALPTLGAVGCSRFKLQVGGDTETLELYMSGAGTVKGWLVYKIT